MADNEELNSEVTPEVTLDEIAPIESTDHTDETPEAVAARLDDDDELFLKAADEKLDDGDSYGIFKQDEGVVSWTITNFIDQNGKQYGKRELRANPPVLTFESSSGEKADFVLTKDFAGSLSEIMRRVHYGYFGLEKKPKKTFTWATAKQSIINAIGARPLQVGAFVLLALVVIIGLIAG